VRLPPWERTPGATAVSTRETYLVTGFLTAAL
jgi:hypothetical protein